MDGFMSSDDEGYELGYSEEDEEDIGVFDSTSTRPLSSIKVITKASLLPAQREDLQKVMELFGVREQHARTLLIHYRWDVERLLAVFVDKGTHALLSQAGLMDVLKPATISSLPSSALVMCDICMDEKEEEEVSRMDCTHCFCNDCWTEYFIMMINEGKSRRVRCMAHKCNAICDEDLVRKLVSGKAPEEAERFERFLLESYIEDNCKVKWCPSVPHCGNAIRVEGDAVCEVECCCGQQFCFNCLGETHSPCSCMMWKLWDSKCKDESESINWITVHTKLCPKCDKPVEKDGGCNLVACLCGQNFCWLCGRATGGEHTWESIAGHNCGRYKAEEDLQRAETDLKRFIHYHNRWKAHMDSFKLERQRMESIQTTISDLENLNSDLKDYSWLTNGLQRLFRARRALSFSYPFAFYMFGGTLFKDEMTDDERSMRQNLFEDQQQQFENVVERLSKLMENSFTEIDHDTIMDIRMQVMNLSALNDTLCRTLYDCIENEILGSLRLTTNHIAPYNSKGVERAAQLD